MKQKLAIAALAILCALLAWSNVRSYLRLPTYQTIYRVAPTPYYAKPSRAWKKAPKEEYVVRVLAEAPPPSDPSDSGSGSHPTRSRNAAPREKSTRTPGSTSTTLSGPAQPKFPLRLGEFELEALPHGGTATPELLESGETRLVVTPSPAKPLEVGRLREAALWGGRSTWAASYQQDIIRTGPVWLRGRAEFGRLVADVKTHWKGEFGIAVRF